MEVVSEKLLDAERTCKELRAEVLGLNIQLQPLLVVTGNLIMEAI